MDITSKRQKNTTIGVEDNVLNRGTIQVKTTMFMAQRCVLSNRAARLGSEQTVHARTG